MNSTVELANPTNRGRSTYGQGPSHCPACRKSETGMIVSLTRPTKSLVFCRRKVESSNEVARSHLSFAQLQSATTSLPVPELVYLSYSPKRCTTLLDVWIHHQAVRYFTKIHTLSHHSVCPDQSSTCCRPRPEFHIQNQQTEN